MSEISSNNKRIAKNTLLLYFRMFLMMAISLYTSRVVLKTLGVEDFGIYNVVGGLIEMFGFINGSMASCTQRFLTIAIGKKDRAEIRKVFSNSIFIQIGVAVIFLLLAETVGLWFLYNKLVIPESRMFAAHWVYQATIFATIIMIMSVPYNAYIIAEERMSAFAYISIIEVVLKLLIVFVVMYSAIDKLIFYAVLILSVQLLVRFCYTRYCSRNFPDAKVEFKFDKPLFKEMMGFSIWNMNGNLAILGATQGLNLLLNMFFGAAVNAARGIAVQVQTKVYSFCTNFVMAVRPQITKSYATGDFKSLHSLILASSKFSYYLLFLLSLPIFFNIDFILDLWLTVVPVYTGEIIIVMLLTCMVRSLAHPLITAVHATGDIRKFQIWEGTAMLLILPMAYILLKFFHINPVQVIMVYLFTEILAQGIRIWIVLPMINMLYSTYLKEVLGRVLLSSVCSVILPFALCYLSESKSFSYRILSVIICLFSVLVSTYFIGCNHSEREFMRGRIEKIKDKFVHKA